MTKPRLFLAIAIPFLSACTSTIPIEPEPMLQREGVQAPAEASIFVATNDRSLTFQPVEMGMRSYVVNWGEAFVAQAQHFASARLPGCTVGTGYADPAPSSGVAILIRGNRFDLEHDQGSVRISTELELQLDVRRNGENVFTRTVTGKGDSNLNDFLFFTDWIESGTEEAFNDAFRKLGDALVDGLERLSVPSSTSSAPASATTPHPAASAKVLVPSANEASPAPSPGPSLSPSPTPPNASAARKFCPWCGAAVRPGAAFCESCGRQF